LQIVVAHFGMFGMYVLFVMLGFLPQVKLLTAGANERDQSPFACSMGDGFPAYSRHWPVTFLIL